MVGVAGAAAAAAAGRGAGAKVGRASSCRTASGSAALAKPLRQGVGSACERG